MGKTTVVILERTRQGEKPDYCVHGYTPCTRCGHACWLGNETITAVTLGQAKPLCMECAHAIHREYPDWGPADTIARLHDHRRADGPHE